jgi:hypothetical protein
MTYTSKIIRLLKNSKSIPVSEFGREHQGVTSGKQLMVALLHTNLQTGRPQSPTQEKQEVLAWVDLAVGA